MVLSLFIFLLFVNNIYSQSSQLVDTTTIDGPVKAGTAVYVTWTGGAAGNIYPITFTLKQGDPGHLVTIAQLDISYNYVTIPSTTADGNYTIELDQMGSVPVYTPYFTVVDGGLPLSSTLVNTSILTASTSQSTLSSLSSSTSISSTSLTDSTSSAQIRSTPSSTSTTSIATPPAIGNTTPGASLLTGTCTSPIFAYATDGSFGGGPYEYPIVGCAGGRPECCPYQLSSSASPTATDYGLLAGVDTLTAPPADYTSVHSAEISISGTCCAATTVTIYCPSGWGLNSVEINGYLNCFSTLSTPLSAPSPIAISYNGNPSYTINQIITSTIFAIPMLQESVGSSSHSLSSGAIAGIAVGVALILIILCITAWFCMRRRERRQRYKIGQQQNLASYDHSGRGDQPNPQEHPTVLDKSGVLRPPIVSECDNLVVSPITPQEGLHPVRNSPMYSEFNTQSSDFSNDKAELEAQERRRRAAELAAGEMRASNDGLMKQELDNNEITRQ